MKNPIQAHHYMLLLCVTILYSACTGQSSSKSIDSLPNNKNPSNSFGEIVGTLGEKVLVIFQDQDNNYWFSGERGAYKYDGENIILYSTKDGLCGNSILGIQEDKKGNIYFDTADGVSLFDGEKFTTLPIAENQGTEHEWRLEPQDLWFRMSWDKNGPYRYDGHFLYPLVFPEIQRGLDFYKDYPNASWSPYGIYNLYQDHSGCLWFGTASVGVCRYDGKSLSWFYEDHLTNTPNGGSFGIRSILEDKDGYLWFSNSRYRYKISEESSVQDGTPVLITTKENGMGYLDKNDQLEYPYFMSITETNDGNLWMATYSDGVYRNNGEELIHYPIQNGDLEVLLFSIYQDNQGTLWLGSHNSGVFKYNGSEFIQFHP